MKVGDIVYVVVDENEAIRAMPDGGGVLMESLEEATSEAQLCARYHKQPMGVRRVRLTEWVDGW